jgi:hypothetical protein
MPKFAAALVAATLLICLTAVPSFAQSAPAPTRADYIAQADPICDKTFSSALPKPKSKRDLRGFIKLYDALGKRMVAMAGRLAEVPKPTADVTGLTNWITALQGVGRGSSKAAAGLRHRSLRGFKAGLSQMNRAQKIRLANSKSFGFKVCR